MTLDVRKHLDAVEAALPAALRTIEPGKSVTSPPGIHAIVHIFRRFGDAPERADGLAGTYSWRVVVKVAGRTRRECWWALLRATEALENTPLVIAGQTTTALRRDTDQADAPEATEDGYFVTSDAWTYTL